MEKGGNNLKSPEIEFLELELGELNSKQIELVNILSAIDFDFENFEPVFVQYPGSGSYYIYQAKRDALAYVGDVVLVPTNSNSNFFTATVSMTFEMIGKHSADDLDLDQVEYAVNSFKNVRHIVANLGRLDGAFFEDYFYETNRKEIRKKLVEAIEKRAKVVKKKEYYESIAKFDSTMNDLLDELEKLGGLYE